MDYLLHCPQCGQLMRVAAPHTRTCIACPHCRYAFRPAAITPLDKADRGGPMPVQNPPLRPALPTHLRTVPKSRIAAGLLGIFFGYLGLHRFYLGYNRVGLVQLCLTLSGFLLHSPLICFTPIVATWGFVEGIFCLLGWLPDADGEPLGP